MLISACYWKIHLTLKPIQTLVTTEVGYIYPALFKAFANNNGKSDWSSWDVPCTKYHQVNKQTGSRWSLDCSSEAYQHRHHSVSEINEQLTFMVKSSVVADSPCNWARARRNLLRLFCNSLPLKCSVFKSNTGTLEAALS